jgi:hypothetical protein
MARLRGAKLLLQAIALGAAAMLGGCVAYPAYPAYGYGYGGYGYGNPGPYYGGGAVVVGGGGYRGGGGYYYR